MARGEDANCWLDCSSGGDRPHGEILVERVEALRWAERDERYARMPDALNAMPAVE